LAINLQKGQRIDLTKGNPGLHTIKIGLGWDAVPQKKGGFFKKLMGGGGAEVDCDASVLMLDSNGKISKKEDLIYYGNLTHPSNSVRHMGDNLTGEGEGDDEELFVDLPKIPAYIHRLIFVVNIYNCQARGQDFGLIENAFIRVVDKASDSELARFNLSENYAGKTALRAGEVYRNNQDWKFAAIGEGTNDVSIGDISKRYQ